MCEEGEVRKAIALPRTVQVWSRQELSRAEGLLLASGPHSFTCSLPSLADTAKVHTSQVCREAGTQPQAWQAEASCALTLPQSGWSWGWNQCIQGLLCSSHFCPSSELGSQANADWDILSPLGFSKFPQASIPFATLVPQTPFFGEPLPCCIIIAQGY